MPFKAVNYLLFENNKKTPDVDVISRFNPHVTIRSFSFYNNGKYADYANDFLNSYFNIFQSSEDQFRFFENMIPKLIRKKINYIKKPKPEENNVPVPEFYSKREIDMIESTRKYLHE